MRYDTAGFILAADVGEALQALGKGFERYARRVAPKGHLRLAVQRLEVGSLIADLVVVGAATGMVIAQHREAIYGFIGFLSDVVAVAQGLKPGKNKVADTRLVETLLRPVADGSAQQVNVFIVGDGNTVTLGDDAVELVRNTQDQNRVRSREREPLTDDVDAKDDAALAALPAPRQLTLRGKHGTVIDVKGRWYVRLEGEGGVLNPLELAASVEVQDDQSYSFDGHWEGRSYRIVSAHPIG